MQCRAVARRLAAGSLTVLGDLAQATSPWSAADWGQTLAPGLGRAGARRRSTRGYRVPGLVLDYANRLLPLSRPASAPPRSVRDNPGRLDVVRVDGARRTGAVVAAVSSATQEPGSVGVITADADVPCLSAALGAAGLPHLAAPTPTTGATRTGRWRSSRRAWPRAWSSTASSSSSPRRSPAAEPDDRTGLRRLYVVLTRAVSGLTVVHADPLPEPLAG